jgi:hypothetical protein
MAYFFNRYSFILVISLVFGSANAAIIASSNFDTGTENWSWLAADPGMSWQSSGGNPGGYIRYDNNIPYAPGYTASIYAPTQYLGDWSAMGVTGFSYEANIFTTGGYAAIGNYQAYISGPGGEFRWVGPAPNPTVDWLTLDVPLVESEWTRISGNWSDTMTDITEFRIVMAYYTGTYPHEITGIDNIQLNAVPLPAAAWFMISGLIGLLGFKKKTH